MGGLWQTQAQLEDNLARKVNKKEKNFHQTHNDSNIFSFSSNGKPLDARQLHSNLLKLMKKPITDDDDEFKIVYLDHDDESVYLQYVELLTDLHNGDLTVL